jgi:hypothetical protein
MSDGPILNIRMQTPGYGDVCVICRGEASGHHSVPMFNGDLMSNDWLGEWFGIPCCERCYGQHERGELRTYDAEYRHLLEGFQGEGDGI